MLVEATSVKTVADRVFNLLKGYGFQIDTYNKEGEVVGDPADAIRFFVEDPNLLVTLNVPTEEIRLSISDNTDQTDTLRKQLSEIAKDYLMMLDFRVFGKTLKPSSEAINISREADMKEQNRMRKLAGLETIKEDRTVVGCNDDQSLYMFLGNEQINLGKTPQEIGAKLKELKPDFSDMYYSSSMDFATECGFENDDSAKELMDASIKAMNDDDVFEQDEEDKPGEMVRYFLKQDFTKMSKEDASTIVSNIAYEKFPSYDMHEDPLDGALDELHDMLDSESMSGYQFDRGEMDNPDVDDFELSDSDYKSLPKIQQLVRSKYIERLNDPDIKDELKGTPADNKGELPGMSAPQESKQAVEETIVVEASLGSMRGSIKTSNQPLGGTKIIVKHTKAVNEEVRGSRSRNIQKIFIENNEERFLFPSKNLNGARAMARHLYNGGQMHDTVGESIVAMCTELKTLKEFANYVKKQGLINEENNDYVELARQHISTIKETFKKLSGVKTYSKAVESLKDMDNIDVVNEVNLEAHFTETHFDDKVGKVHETISKLVNRQTAFESMIMKTIESENFVGIKELISEDPLDFATPEAKLGHQVSQLGSTAKNPQLASYLGSISNKLSNGGQMNQFEYRAVKASLLSAQRPEQAQMAEQFTEEQQYTKFIESFITEE